MVPCRRYPDGKKALRALREMHGITEQWYGACAVGMTSRLSSWLLSPEKSVSGLTYAPKWWYRRVEDGGPWYGDE